MVNRVPLFFEKNGLYMAFCFFSSSLYAKIEISAPKIHKLDFLNIISSTTKHLNIGHFLPFWGIFDKGLSPLNYFQKEPFQHFSNQTQSAIPEEPLVVFTLSWDMLEWVVNRILNPSWTPSKQDIPNICLKSNSSLPVFFFGPLSTKFGLFVKINSLKTTPDNIINF